MIDLAFLLSLLFAIPLIAQDVEYFSGHITRNTQWSGYIYIDGDVVVERGVVLSIEPGSRVFFKPKTDRSKSGRDPDLGEFIVLGTLIAKGKPQNGQIFFTSYSRDPRIGDWYGIEIKNLKDNSILENCVVEYAYKGITCYGSSPEISHSRIRFNYYAGISCEIRSRPVIRNSIILGNEFAGINCELASNPVIENTTITQNGHGVIVFDRSQPDLGHLPAAEGQSSGGNLIFNNFDYNIYNHSSMDIFAQNNIWNTFEELEIQESVYDHEDNPGYGQVIYLPLQGQPSPILSRRGQEGAFPPGITSPLDTLRQDTLAGTQESLVGTVPESLAQETPLRSDTVASSGMSTRQPAGKAQSTAVKPETVYVFRQVPKPAAEKKEEKIPVEEPIIEALLDSGRREYVRRVKPDYPEIYKKTFKEGVVIMEVVVDRDGSVKQYRILRSDGDLFSLAAESAISKFVYKPGTFNGTPISFKIVERFKFQLNR